MVLAYRGLEMSSSTNHDNAVIYLVAIGAMGVSATKAFAGT